MITSTRPVDGLQPHSLKLWERAAIPYLLTLVLLLSLSNRRCAIYTDFHVAVSTLHLDRNSTSPGLYFVPCRLSLSDHLLCSFLVSNDK
ncbi:hypothetical protein EDD15DRAFT_2285326, partial [Pisolithus albus]